MYQRFPGGAGPAGPAGSPATTTTIPQSVQRAVLAMYVGVAASLIGIAVDLTALSAIRSAIAKRSPALTTARLNTTVHVELGVLIAGGLIGAALWLWMAQSCKAGKGWARTVSTVLFAVDTISLLASLRALGGSGLSHFYGLVVWVIGLIAIILLWQRSSSDYFRGAPGPPGPAPR